MTALRQKILIAIVLINFVCTSSEEPTVKLRQGILIGIQIYPESYPGPIHAYLGIPYAVAPVGINRFSPPKKHPGWNRTLVASNNPPNCLHLNNDSDLSQRQSEDCLFINVWTPVVSERMNNVPVVVYIDGIDFNRLNSFHPISGQDLAAEGVVVVTLNYRLHALGFLCFGDRDLRGNFGLLDQYMALLWVHENIGSFGGDASSVTLMGHDSGATSVLYHLISSRTKNLFSRAIIMVGSVKSLWDLRRNASEIITSSKKFVKHVGCPFDNTRSTLECIRNKNPEEIITSSGQNVTIQIQDAAFLSDLNFKINI